MTDWEPIEDAPKDGTEIFIYKDRWHGALIAKWDLIDGEPESFHGWVFKDEYLIIGVAEGCLGFNEDIEDGDMPTHWSHVPPKEPPK